MDLQVDESSFPNPLIDDEIGDDEIDDVQSPNQAVNENGKKKNNFTNDEDIILVSSWLNTSIDAVNGTDQKNKKFWSRISKLYFENTGANYPQRSEASLNSRWHFIQRRVNKFQGCFAQIENKNASGTTEKEKIDEAKQMYHNIHKATFKFIDCWNVLRAQPKWMTRNSLPSKRRMYSSCSPGIHNSIDLEDSNNPDKPSEYIERPPGKKAGKEALKKRKGKEKEGYISDILENWKEHRSEMQEKKLKMQEEKIKIFSIESENNMKIEKYKIDIENKKVELKAKKIQLQETQQEINIVLMDTSTLDEGQKKYVEALRAKIFVRSFE